MRSDRVYSCGGRLQAALVFIAALGLGAALHSQTPAFDVASVKPNVSTGDPSAGVNPSLNGRLTATNVPLRTIIVRAYDIHDSQLIGAPEWTASERFDIDARASSPPLDGPGALIPMLRPLLAERFALKARMETRELPAYLLIHARGDQQLGKQIRPTSIDCEAGRRLTPEEMRANARDGWPPCGGTFTVSFMTKTAAGATVMMRIRRSAITMTELATSLRPAVNRPVVDRTGLEGRFDVEYSYSPQPPNPNVESAFGPDAPMLFIALEEQLGLKLESQRTEIPVVVVDSVARLTAN